MKKGAILVTIINGLLGVFIGGTAVYAIVYHDVYYGGACLMAILVAVIMTLALVYVNNIIKETKDED